MTKRAGTIIMGVLLGLIPAGCAGTEGVTSASAVHAKSDMADGTDWDGILEHLKSADLSDSGFFYDCSEAEEEIGEFGCLTFRNYESDFRAVDDQITVSYGRVMKPGTDSPEWYEDPAFEIAILSNEDYNEYYYAVCSEQGEYLYEEGEWYLSQDRDATVSGWIGALGTAMGVQDGE